MKAGVIFTGTGPILIITTYPSLLDDELADKFVQKGIGKYIASEVDVQLCRKRYGRLFESIEKDLGPHDFRVLDYNGHNVFHTFSFNELGEYQFMEKSGPPGM